MFIIINYLIQFVFNNKHCRKGISIDTLKCMSCSSKERFININCNCMTIPLRVTRNDGITIRYKEKEMTKEEIEKLLGYKIKIIG